MLIRSIGWVYKRAEDFRQRKRCIESELECVHGVPYFVLVVDVLFGHRVHRAIKPSIALQLNNLNLKVHFSKGIFALVTYNGNIKYVVQRGRVFKEILLDRLQLAPA